MRNLMHGKLRKLESSKNMRMEVELFKEQSESFVILSVGTLVVVLLFLIYYCVMLGTMDQDEDIAGDYLVLWLTIIAVLLSFGIATVSITNLYLKIKLRKSIQTSADIYDEEWIRCRNFFRSWTLLGVSTLFSLRLLSRVGYGQCPNDSSDTWYCNPNQHEDGIPLDSTLSVMIIPMTASVILNNDWHTALFSWAECVVSLCVAAAMVNINNFTNPVVVGIGVFIPASFSLIYMNEHNFSSMFNLNRQLKKTLAENERLAEENHANELRSMIGNVAHDLKTPLMSLLSGIELVEQEVAELMKMSSTGDCSFQDVLDHANCIREYTDNMRDVNSFMTMTVNRCIDFTKASKGFKLVPKPSTVDILATMTLPIKIIRNFQSRVEIRWDGENLDKDICSHIITDHQWLQENLLCLLSNAVKYSNKGAVDVWMEKIQIPKKKRVGKPKNLLRMSLDMKKNERITLKTFAVSAFKSKPVRNNKVYLSTENGDREKNNEIPPDNTNEVENENKSSSSILSPTNRRESFTSHFSLFSKQNSSGSHESKDMLASRSFSSKNGAGVAPGLIPENIPEDQPFQPEDPEEIEFDEVLRFTVQDAGIGLSVAAMKSLFSPFKQAQRLAGGTGLGLFSLAKRMEALQGEYGVRRRDDGKQGCVFWFDIPYRPDTFAAEQAIQAMKEDSNQWVSRSRSLNINYSVPMIKPEGKQRRSMDGDMTYAQRLLTTISPTMSSSDSTKSNYKKSLVPLPKSLRILLVDDSLPITKMTCKVLEKQGHFVVVAENGFEALEKLSIVSPGCEHCTTASSLAKQDSATPGSISPSLHCTSKDSNTEVMLAVNKCGWEKFPLFDVVLMDLQMPVMDGLEATRRLRHLEKLQGRMHGQINKRQLVVGVSANSDDVTRVEAFRVGMDDFIAKPFSIDQFYQSLHKLNVHL